MKKKIKNPQQNVDEKKQLKMSYQNQWDKTKVKLNIHTNNMTPCHNFGPGSTAKPTTYYLHKYKYVCLLEII